MSDKFKFEKPTLYTDVPFTTTNNTMSSGDGTDKVLKRWGLWRRFKEDSLMVVHGEYDMSQLGPCDTAVKVMPVADHDRIVAELRAESEFLLDDRNRLHEKVLELRSEVETKRNEQIKVISDLSEQLTEARAEVEALKSSGMKEHLRKQLVEKQEVIATQARVIEKLKATVDGTILYVNIAGAEYLREQAKELAAITKFEKEGAKDNE